MHEQLIRMRAIAGRHADGPSHATTLPRVALHTGTVVTKPTPGVYEPAVCLVLQGAKQITIGDRLLRYDPASYFVSTIDLPARGWVVEATPDRPYLSVSLKLDLECLTALMLEVPGVPDGDTTGFAVSAVTPALLGAWERLLGLLDAPGDASILARCTNGKSSIGCCKGLTGACCARSPAPIAGSARSAGRSAGCVRISNRRCGWSTSPISLA